jgi:hypothetical protein
MKPGILVLSLATVVVASSNATTIRLQNFSDDGISARPITTCGNFLVPSNTGFVSIGTFATLTDAAITALGGPGRNALLADFLAFADSVNNPTPIGDASAFNIPGLYSDVLNGTNAAGDPKIGKAIYTLIGNGPTFASSTQIAVVKDNDTFVLDDQPVIAANVFIHEPSSVILIGVAGPQTTVPGLGTFGSLQFDCIPEPSVLTFLSLCFVALRRRVR